MEIVNRENPNKVKYFELKDYISKIRLNSNVLEHMEETNKEFDSYMKRINVCEEEDVIHLWLISMAEELVKSNQIERHYVKKQDILKEDLYIQNLNVNHERIHEIRNFVLKDEPINGYRKGPVRVSAIYKDKPEKIFWWGPEAEDVPKFMNDFIDVYNSKEMSVIDSNPFLKSALIQLLFIRIHPYSDGNGRTARLLHGMKFTEAVNKVYDKNYKLCPLNISGNILINQYTYVDILDNIYFDLEHDNNLYINKWFNFILNMIDEQLYYSNSKLNNLRKTYDLYKLDDEKFNKVFDKIINDMLKAEVINNLEPEKVLTLLK